VGVAVEAFAGQKTVDRMFAEYAVYPTKVTWHEALREIAIYVASP
jgi:hypothetical protein